MMYALLSICHKRAVASSAAPHALVGVARAEHGPAEALCAMGQACYAQWAIGRFDRFKLEISYSILFQFKFWKFISKCLELKKL
jgi:hypothetical protein